MTEERPGDEIEALKRTHVILFLEGFAFLADKAHATKTLTEMALEELACRLKIRLDDLEGKGQWDVQVIEHLNEAEKSSRNSVYLIPVRYIELWPAIHSYVWARRAWLIGEAFWYWLFSSCAVQRAFLYTRVQTTFFFVTLLLLLVHIYSMIPLGLTAAAALAKDDDIRQKLQKWGNRLGNFLPRLVLDVVTLSLPFETLVSVVCLSYCYMTNRNAVRNRITERVKSELIGVLRNDEVRTVTLLCHCFGVAVGIHAVASLLSREPRYPLSKREKENLISANEKHRIVTLAGSLPALGQREPFIRRSQLEIQTWLNENCRNGHPWHDEAKRWIDLCGDKDFLCAPTIWIDDIPKSSKFVSEPPAFALGMLDGSSKHHIAYFMLIVQMWQKGWCIR